MLYSIDAEEEINYIPHEREYRIWRSRLSDDDYRSIRDDLNTRIAGSEIQTSSWIPGADWRGTPFEPLYYACNCDEQAAAKFFGLILWEVIREKPEYWAFGRYEKDGIPIEGLTYFVVHPRR